MSAADRSCGAGGPGQWAAAAGTSALTCNPRKFSEKIALHNQRQAEDTAAFQQVMMDITSTRIQAQRLRQAESLASYYGGSLPNVNQMLTCSTETKEPPRADRGQRDHRPIPHGRPSRRHTDSAPYLALHLSPPSGPSWRRQWSNRSVNRRSQVDHLTVTTLSRTNSDSALHTSVRITSITDSNPATALTSSSRQSGTSAFQHSVPMIEEAVQEEGKPFQPLKMPSLLSGFETPGNCAFPSPDLSCSHHSVPSLSTSGSLPDLSTLHLPSAVPEAIDPESQIHTSSLSGPISVHHIPSTAAHPAVKTDTDCPLPNLSSSLQASTNNPLLQSSLSNPNLLVTLSSHSLVESFSSTSLSLSNSSLQSSLSNQSLQSSLSSSSLSNQSAQSAASQCSYSSGIGGSPSSMSCSPQAPGQGMVPGCPSSWKRTHLNPLIVPSGEQSHWQQPKQLSPNISPTVSSINQRMPLETIKVQEAKPPANHYSQISIGHPMAYQSLQCYQPEGWDQSRQDSRKQCLQPVMQQSSSPLKSQPQYSQHSHYKAQHLFMNTHHFMVQQLPHEQKQNLSQCQQAQYKQQSLQQQCQQPQQCPSQHHTQPLQNQQQYQEMNQDWNPPLQVPEYNQYQQQYYYQSQPAGPPGAVQEQQPSAVMVSQDQDACWQNQVNQYSLANSQVQGTQRASMHEKEPLKVHPKMPVRDCRRERAMHYPEGIHSLRDHVQLSEVASQDKEFVLHNESYFGLHLTPSQTEALSKKLGQFQKEPADVLRIADSKCHNAEHREMAVAEHPWYPQTQSHSKEGLPQFSSTTITVPSPWIDDELPDLPDSIPEFDLEPFALED